jgi:serine/threonine-protein kinase
MAAPDIKRLGRYDIELVLGKGAMGVVYGGIDPRLHRKVAIKTILKSALDPDTAKEYSMRFSREAQAVARLNHANIVQVYDFGEEGDIAYIVMEFIKGKELKNFFDANERFEIKEAVRIMSELCDALHFAHEAGIIHRDIKPANVMIDSQGRVKLADFGVARITDTDRTQAERTQAGTMVGTPAYMSPEQITGGNIDRRTDIFSAGIILYQFLTGEKPFTGSGAWTIAKKIIQDHPPAPSTINPGVTPPFDLVVNKALAKNVEDRYQTARDLGAALKRALEGKVGEEDSDKTVVGGMGGPGAAPMPQVAVARADASGTRAGATAAGTTSSQEVELEFWRAIKDGNDPDDFELYVQQFPSGIYAALAKRKIAKLKGVAPEETSAKAKEQEKKEAEEAAQREAEVKQKLAEEKAKLEAELTRREAEYKKREEEARARAEAEAKARAEEFERQRKEAEALAAKREAEAKARYEAEMAKREAEAKARREAEEKARKEADEKARKEAEALAAKREAEAAKREAEAKARYEAEMAKREAEAKARREADEKARKEIEERAKKEAEALRKAQAEAEARAKKEAEERAKREAEAAKREAELKKKLAEAPKAKVPVAPIIGALIAIAAVGGGAYYYLTAEQRARQAALTQALEVATKAAEDLTKAKQAEVEALKRVSEARAAEEAARKAGDQAKLKELQEATKRAEAEAAKQAELVKQREAARAKAIEDAQKAKAEAEKRAQADKAKAEKKVEVAAVTPKPEAPKVEAPKVEAPKPEAPKPEAPKAEAPKPAAPVKAEAPKREPRTRAEREAARDEELARKALAAARKDQEVQVAAATPSAVAPGAAAPTAAAPAVAAVVPKAIPEHEALYEKARSMEGSDAKGAVRLYRQAARKGSGKAAKRLGEIFDKGLAEISRDYQESLSWYEKARELGETVETVKSR